MRIVTYNLRAGGSRSEDNHWRQVIKTFAPDLILAQESLAPEKYLRADELVEYKGRLHSNAPHGRWGSAMLYRNSSVESVSLPGFEGWVVGGKFSGFSGSGDTQSVMAFSIHTPSPGPYEPTVDRILDAIRDVWDGSPLVLAGDFNITTGIRHPSEGRLRNTKGELKTIERLRREFGVVNAWQLLHPNENLPQTLRWSRAREAAYHCDAIFLDHRLIRGLASVTVESQGIWATHSDHNPIVATFA